VLTSSTIDVVDETSGVPQTAMHLDYRLLEDPLESPDTPHRKDIQFFIDAGSMRAIVLETGYSYPGYDGFNNSAPYDDSVVFILDLNRMRILKRHTISYRKIEPTEFCQQLRMTVDSTNISLVSEKGENLLTFSKRGGKVTFVKSNIGFNSD
jgi:hypothetical protein